MDTKKISSFTGLRFIMIMLIVSTHFDRMIQFLGTCGALYYRYTFDFFMLAVDFFFMLSGFGMMFSYLNKVPENELKLPQLSYGIKYAVNHVKKIYPVYIATIIFGIIMVFIQEAFVYHILSLGLVIKGIIRILLNVSLLQSATGMAYFTHAYNGASWFLSSLFCIYIISPFVMFVLRKKSKNIISDLLFIVVNIVIILILNHFFSIAETKLKEIKGIPDVDSLVYISPYRRFFYVAIGMNIAMLVNRFDRDSLFSEKKATLFEVIISVTAIIYYSILRPYIVEYSFSVIVEMLILTSFLFIFSLDKGYISKLLGKPIMQALGNMAMYIFLIHFVILQHFINIVYDKWGWTFVSVFTFIVVILVITFAFSWLLYRKDKSKVKKEVI